MRRDLLEHPFGLIENPFVLKSKYFDLIKLEKQRTFVIVLLSLSRHVDLSVKLDGKSFHRTIEIENIKINTMLPPKLATFELRIFQHVPQSGFGGREPFS